MRCNFVWRQLSCLNYLKGHRLATLSTGEGAGL
jgi:hypothetical protein